jgi:hypothetical protein
MVERPFGWIQVASGRAISREFLASWLPDKKKSICLNLRHLWNTFGFGAPGHPPFSKKERKKSRRFLRN